MDALGVEPHTVGCFRCRAAQCWMRVPCRGTALGPSSLESIQFAALPLSSAPVCTACVTFMTCALSYCVVSAHNGRPNPPTAHIIVTCHPGSYLLHVAMYASVTCIIDTRMVDEYGYLVKPYKIPTEETKPVLAVDAACRLVVQMYNVKIKLPKPIYTDKGGGRLCHVDMEAPQHARKARVSECL